MSIVEIEAAIAQLPAEEIGELRTWLDRYHNRILGLDESRFDSLITEAYASGEPSPLTKTDIDDARRVVKDRIAARNLAQ